MQPDVVRQVKSNPKYHDLVAKRSAFGWTLAVVMLVIYYGFILVIAYSPTSLAAKVGAGATMSIGMPLGVAIIVSAFLLTGIYVARANSEFDRLTHEIVEAVK
ncbi:DUF485 domain-containing protein [Plasticicumulans sp.]|uniref:DUF485 domain-containing protein n=1 Tax=Plasticicumulans sp. TaxID=2307179 RepID=UPI000FB4113E|nr:DUF485 domain-containing protein [Plasticicumulans sp.]MBS0602771.1 DUF485 domain-containing protein [Pseudomonadota bacterium]RTK98009.1 MAG: DUF485 domain-containing protein [Xanthomonadales bacterium]HMV38368.1 DUF485 domain-containing protein [Plasticicumulans sp.]HMW28390.1 DUF485 domain-containing protein [Plasticicumulans sp.]HMW41718.1 DUF485 domain-containing protein [Plasticicumulans sp.]